MNIWKDVLTLFPLTKEKIKIVPDNEEDKRIAEILTNMVNYAKSHDVDAPYFCCMGHQFNERDPVTGKCPECIKDM